MNKPRISWFVLENYDGENSYVPKKKHEEEDSYSPGDTMKIRLQVWNNIGGAEDVATINNAKLVVYFKSFENNLFLNLIEVKKGSDEFKKLTLDMDRGYFELGSLSGRKNNGSEANIDNYYDIELKLGPIPSNVKSEIKDFVLDIEYSDNRN